MNEYDQNSGTDSENGVTIPMARFRSDYLYELARRKDPEARRELGNVVTDLFISAKLSLREQDIVADILITMLKQAEKDLRLAISERLSNLEQAPLRVVLYLSNDDIDVARPILTYSPVFEEMDMMLVIETRDSEYWQAIAARADLRAAVIRALVETRDVPTARVLVNNNEINIPADSFAILGDMSETANDLSVPLLKRKDLPQDLVSNIYRHVGATIRENLEQVLPPERWAIVKEHVDDVIAEHVDNVVDKIKPPGDAMMEAAEGLKKRGKLTFDGVLQALKNDQISSFIAQLIVFSGLGFKKIQEMISEEDGLKMAALCRIHRIEKKTFLKFFLMTQKLRHGERMVDPMHLNAALSKYDFMPMEDAKAILEK